MTKPRPERVHRPLVEWLFREQPGRDRGSAFSDYIVARFRSTGNLAPGCDARDFLVVWDELAKGATA